MPPPRAPPATKVPAASPANAIIPKEDDDDLDEDLIEPFTFSQMDAVDDSGYGEVDKLSSPYVSTSSLTIRVTQS
jgi:hypothetical protein